MKKIKILFTGGGSGGHLMPLVAVARELRRLSENFDGQPSEKGGKTPTTQIQLHYMGPNDPMGRTLLSQENVHIHTVVSGKIRSYFSFENFTDIIFKIPFGFLQSFFLLFFINPQIVFSKGGTGSVVVVMAARVLGIPVFIHESDTVPGQSNRLAASWAKKIFIAFEKTEYFDLQKAECVGNPIKKELLEGDIASAQEIFNLTLQKPIVLFLGGSQGAQPLNDFVLNIANDLLKNYEVIHVCGEKNHVQVEAEAEVAVDKDLAKYYHVRPFLREVELKHAYKAAGLVVSRGGSGSIFEIAACGKPSILIPLPSAAGNHQSKNVYAYAATGAAIVIEQDNLNPHFFLEKLNFLFSHPAEMQTMKQKALAFSKPLAARAIAREILEYLNAR